MQHWRNRHLLLLDLLLIPLAIYGSFMLRLERIALNAFLPGFLILALAAMVLIPSLLYHSQLYSQHWGYASFNELLALALAVSAALLIAGLIQLLGASLAPVLNIPRSVPLIALPLTLGAVAVPRVTLRLLLQREPRAAKHATQRNVLVVGSGTAGALTVRELQSNPQLGKRVVGLLDDDPRTHAMTIHGVMVLGDHTAIPRLTAQLNVKQVIIAMPSAPGKAIREITQLCAATKVEPLIIPGLAELLDGRAQITQLRQVEIADLLRRAPVETDMAGVQRLLRGQVVLVTGGGGSIGSELCRQILRCRPAELIILGHGENSVFEIQQELLRSLAQQPDPPRITPLIADIRDAARLQALFMRYRPALVFHAAAHKHVPLMEQNLVEAVSNNVLGTRNLLVAARQAEVNHFVMISSDKAVNPTSVMGATKRIAELLVHAAARSSRRPYVAVRFGNVLGSRGSVILTFKRQIAAGGPLTVTDPEMRRYFMTIPESVQLVLQAATLSRQGAIFMLDMGEPVKIVDLARDMIRLSGLEEGRDIDIAYTGLRPGEKLFEELFAHGEGYCPTSHAKLFIAEHAAACVPSNLPVLIAELERSVQLDDEPDLLRLIQLLVPEYQAPGLLLAQVNR